MPELNPSEARNKGKPFRELLKQHQLDAKCAVCHKNIDPVGFAFQNFDLSGRRRDVEHESYKRGELDGRVAWAGEGQTRPVDATGRLPRGEEFKTFAEFKQPRRKPVARNRGAWRASISPARLVGIRGSPRTPGRSTR